MSLYEMALQAEAGGAVLAAVIAAVIISAVFYAVQRRGISEMRRSLQPLQGLDPKIQYDVSRIDTELRTASEALGALRTELPHTTEVEAVQQNIQRLCTDFTELRTNLEGQMDKFKLVTTEDLHRTKDEMIKDATRKITEQATGHLVANSVSKEEFESLSDRVKKMIGTDGVAERMAVLAPLFDSSQIKTLNWQCKLIKLLKGGLAPDAEEDLIVSEGIPKSSYDKFLRRLADAGMVEEKQIAAFYLAPDKEWIYSYVDNPDWLQRRIEKTVKNESDYKRYIKDNLHLVEEGLLFEESEYRLATGKIDIVCRDTAGKTVGIELKYPAAQTGVKRQIAGYKKDHEEKTGRTDSRFFVVAPSIPDGLKELLAHDGFEYREIELAGDGAGGEGGHSGTAGGETIRE